MRTHSRQGGAVLLVSLLMLLLITIVGFSAMETSNLEAKMATARELKEITFQTAEAIIEESTSDLKMLGQAYSVYLQDPEDPEPDWPEDTTHTITGYDSGSRKLEAAGTSTVRYIINANSLGMGMRKGAAGLQTYYYEVQADSTIASANVSDRHVQGVYVEAPRLD